MLSIVNYCFNVLLLHRNSALTCAALTQKFRPGNTMTQGTIKILINARAFIRIITFFWEGVGAY